MKTDAFLDSFVGDIVFPYGFIKKMSEIYGGENALEAIENWVQDEDVLVRDFLRPYGPSQHLIGRKMPKILNATI